MHYAKRSNRACLGYFKLLGLILGALQTGPQGPGAVWGGSILKYSNNYRAISLKGKKYIQLKIILSPVKKIISLKNICLFAVGLEQAVSLRTPSLLAAISQQSLEEVSKSICETSFLPSLNYLDLEVEGLFPRFRWHHSGQRHGWRVF